MTIPQQIGPYTIIDVIGQGGMGVVYRARHDSTGKEAALKTVLVPNENMIQSIRREIHALSRMDHRGIIGIRDHGLHGNLPWFAMEFLQGPSLRDYFKTMMEQTWTTISRIHRDSEMTGSSFRNDDRTADVSSFSRSKRVITGKNTGLSKDLMDIQAEDEKKKPWQVNENFREALENNKKSLSPLSQTEQFRSNYLPSIITMVHKISLALACLHGEGIVHRDLKPDNIVITDKDRPVILDFGLVTEFMGMDHRDALFIEKHTMGTVNYMAPEQIRGDFVDARTDLYALGCILYELLTGSPPFHSQNPRQVTQGHLFATAPPPSRLNPDIPGDLDTLVTRLLEKSPRKRIGYADTVGRLLLELGAERDDKLLEKRAKAYVYRTVLTGRDDIVTTFRSRLDHTSEKDEKIVFFGGDSGMGKTRLASELGKEATRRNLMVITGQCTEDRGGALLPFHKAFQDIYDFCVQSGKSTVDQILGNRGKVLSLFFPQLKELPGIDRYPEPPELATHAAKIRLFNYLTETFIAYADGKRLFIILDDIHWADELTLHYLAFCLRSELFLNASILVGATFLSDNVPELLQRLIGSSGTETVMLNPLNDDSITTLLKDMLAWNVVPAAFSNFLIKHAEGNPYFVVEYLHTAIEQNLLCRDYQGHWQINVSQDSGFTSQQFEDFPIPVNLKGLFSQRVQNLPEKLLPHAQLASVLGTEFPDMLFQQLTALKDNEFFDMCLELESLQILREKKGNLSGFVNDKIRRLLYETIPESSQPDIHFRAARLFDSLYPDNDEFSASIALHWEKAGNHEKARDLYLRAAKNMLRQYNLADAEHLFRSYLKLTETEDQQSIRARLRLAKFVLLGQGRIEEAIEELNIALQEAQNLILPVEIAESFHSLSFIYLRTGNFSQAYEFLETAIEMSLKNDNKITAARAYLDLAVLFIIQGNMEEAVKYFDESLTLFRETGNKEGEGKLLAQYANLHKDHGQFKEAEEKFTMALTIAEELKDRHFQGLVLSNYANLFNDQGKFEEAQRYYDQALVLLAEVGDRSVEGMTRHNLAEMKKQTGKLPESQKLYEQALATHREMGNIQFEGITLLNLGIIHHHLGSMLDSRNRLEKAWEIAINLGDKRTEALILRWQATLSRQIEGDYEKAEERLEQSIRILTELNAPMELAEVLCEKGFLTLARGNSAEPLIEETRKLVATFPKDSQIAVAKTLKNLVLSQEALNTGKSALLYHGEFIQTMPTGLQVFIRKKSMEE